VTRPPRTLLAQIPALRLIEIPDGGTCCGSAGVYNLLRPEPAAALGERKARNLVAVEPDVVAAANPGCALQIAAHAAALGRPLQVLHPVQLLWRSLEGGSATASSAGRGRRSEAEWRSIDGGS
jgi:glycolate oxidase iron-sulfur subunit